jgi:hypothetical protein
MKSIKTGSNVSSFCNCEKKNRDTMFHVSIGKDLCCLVDGFLNFEDQFVFVENPQYKSPDSNIH